MRGFPWNQAKAIDRQRLFRAAVLVENILGTLGPPACPAGFRPGDGKAFAVPRRCGRNSPQGQRTERAPEGEPRLLFKPNGERCPPERGGVLEANRRGPGVVDVVPALPGWLELYPSTCQARCRRQSGRLPAPLNSFLPLRRFAAQPVHRLYSKELNHETHETHEKESKINLFSVFGFFVCLVCFVV
jgi:hypothetical protein